MNIFILDRNPKIAASYHCDKHVVKMILESAQMLSTAHWIKLLESKQKSAADFKRVKDMKEYLYSETNKKLHPPYKLTHHRHPCTIWTHQTKENYMWHVCLFKELCTEYTRRYKKIHKSEQYYTPRVSCVYERRIQNFSRSCYMLQVLLYKRQK